MHKKYTEGNLDLEVKLGEDEEAVLIVTPKMKQL